MSVLKADQPTFKTGDLLSETDSYHLSAQQQGASTANCKRCISRSSRMRT